MSVFDLSIGGGIQIAEIQSMGENPYAMVLTPDGNHLVVSNYTGDVVEDVAHSTLAILISIHSDRIHIANAGGEPMIWLLFGYGCTQNYRTMHCLMVLLQAQSFAETGMWEQPWVYCQPKKWVWFL